MNIRTQKKLELIHQVPMYLVSILIMTAGEVIILYKIDIPLYHQKIGLVEIWFSIFRFFDNILGYFGVGLFLFLVGLILSHYTGTGILYNSGLLNKENKNEKKMSKKINLIIVSIISILLIPEVSKFLLRLK
jgi:hypothetical protein